MKRNTTLVLALIFAVITTLALHGLTSAQGVPTPDPADPPAGSAPAKTTPDTDDPATPPTVSDSLTVLRLKHSNAQVAVETLRQLYPAARMAADPRTNSIFVAKLSQAEMQGLEAVVRRLDQPVGVAAGTPGGAGMMGLGAPPLTSGGATGAGAVDERPCIITLDSGAIEFQEHEDDPVRRIALAEVADRVRGRKRLLVRASADTPYSVVRQIVSAAEMEGMRVELRDTARPTGSGAGLPPAGSMPGSGLMSADAAADRIRAMRENYEARERAARELANKQEGVFRGHGGRITVGSGEGSFGAGGAGMGDFGFEAGGGDESLRQKVTEAFEARQQLLRLELDQFRNRLRHIEQTIETRERLKETIIQKRVEELLHPETRWDPATGNQQSNREEANRQAAGADISSRLVEAAALRLQVVREQFHTGTATLKEVVSAATELTAVQLQQLPANAPQRLTILRRQVELLTEMKDLTTKSYQAGVATQSQVLTVETELLKAQQQLLKEFPAAPSSAIDALKPAGLPPDPGKSGDVPQSKTDLEKIQGTWSLVSQEINGEKPESVVKRHWTIKDGKATVSWEREPNPDAPGDQGNKGNVELTFAIDPSKSPKEITFFGEGGLLLLEVYKLERDTLTLCCFGRAELARPKGFSVNDAYGLGEGNNNLVVEVFRREQAVNNDETPKAKDDDKPKKADLGEAKAVQEQGKKASVTYLQEKPPVRAELLGHLLRQMAWDRYEDERLNVRTTEPAVTLTLTEDEESVDWASGVIKSLNAAT